MTPSRASKQEVARRVETVLKWRLDGLQLSDLIDQAEPPWNVSERQLARYIKAADESIARRRDKRRARIVALHMARREAWYAKCVNTSDFGTAARILADLAKLQDLYADGREVRDLLRLVADSNAKIKELEDRLNASVVRDQGPSATTSPPA